MKKCISNAVVIILISLSLSGCSGKKSSSQSSGQSSYGSTNSDASYIQSSSSNSPISSPGISSSSVSAAQKVSETIIPVSKDGKWGYTGQNGRLVVDYQYDESWGVFNNIYCVIVKNDIIYKKYPSGEDVSRTFVNEDKKQYAIKRYNVDTSIYLADFDAQYKMIKEFAANLKTYVKPYEEKLKAANEQEFINYEYYRDRANDLELAKLKADNAAMDRLIEYWDNRKDSWADSFRY